MKTLIENPERQMILEFARDRHRKPVPVRVAFFDNVPYFSARDICAEMGGSDEALQAAFTVDYPRNAKRIVDETTDGVPSNGVYLGPVACWYWSHLVDAYRWAPVASWTRREARKLRPDASESDPSFSLTLREDGSMPPAATKFSGYQHSWRDLRYSEAYFQALTNRVSRNINAEPRLATLGAAADAARQAAIAATAAEACA